MYYDGNKLLSMLDINGNKPEIYICTTNRSAGKTTYYNRYLVKRFLKFGEKFTLLYRFSYEITDCADKFFKEIGRLFFPDQKMSSKKRGNGVYYELYLNNKSCGYAIAINNADQIKKYSHLMADTCRILFDEFQSENNKYCSNEINKFISIHYSIARGNGEQVRYVPVFLLSNAISILNPYFVALGISERIQSNTNYLRGDGFVLESGFYSEVSNKQSDSPFNRAFSSSKYIAYAGQNIYLNDNNTFIEKIQGKNRYLCTIKYLGKTYAIREYPEQGIIYCDKNADLTFNLKISVTTEDHQINYVMLKNNDFIINQFRYYFDRGCFRFKDLSCKEAVMKLLSY